ncbi:MAG: 30S ribosomal protein S27e [Methanomassiliicoccales archaeon]
MSGDRAKFVIVKCADCSSEQIVFERASTVVTCKICGATIASPTGGKAKLRAASIRAVEDATGTGVS